MYPVCMHPAVWCRLFMRTTCILPFFLFTCQFCTSTFLNGYPHSPSIEEFEAAQAALASTPVATTYARIDLVSLNDKPVIMELELTGGYHLCPYRPGKSE
jgi:hypothetical protein